MSGVTYHKTGGGAPPHVHHVRHHRNEKDTTTVKKENFTSPTPTSTKPSGVNGLVNIGTTGIKDAGEFKSARDSYLNDFTNKYNQLKAIYTQSVKDALAETDKPRQTTLISRVLDANKAMSALINAFTANIDPNAYTTRPEMKAQMLSDADVLKKEHEDIQQGASELGALKNIIDRNKEDKKEVTDTFQIYAIWIFIAIAILIYVIVTRGPSLSAFNTKPSMPVVTGGHR